MHPEVAVLPIVGHPTHMHLQIPRFRCETAACGQSIFRAGIDDIVALRTQVTCRTTAWILRRMIVDKMNGTAVAASLGLGWDTVNTIALSAARNLAAAPQRLDRVRTLGVHEHKWKHLRGQAIRVSCRCWLISPGR